MCSQVGWQPVRGDEFFEGVGRRHRKVGATRRCSGVVDIGWGWGRGGERGGRSQAWVERKKLRRDASLSPHSKPLSPLSAKSRPRKCLSARSPLSAASWAVYASTRAASSAAVSAIRCGVVGVFFSPHGARGARTHKRAQDDSTVCGTRVGARTAQKKGGVNAAKTQRPSITKTTLASFLFRRFLLRPPPFSLLTNAHSRGHRCRAKPGAHARAHGEC